MLFCTAKLKTGHPIIDGDAWVVWVNEDLTEGRGGSKVLALCQKESTARRLAKGADVQGSDGTVMQLPVARLEFTAGGLPELFLYGPYGPCQLKRPTKEDVFQESRLTAKRAKQARKEEALQRARELGMSEEDICALQESLEI